MQADGAFGVFRVCTCALRCGWFSRPALSRLAARWGTANATRPLHASAGRSPQSTGSCDVERRMDSLRHTSTQATSTYHWEALM